MTTSINKFFGFLAAFCAIAIGYSAASAGTISTSGTAPTVDGADIANLVGTLDLGGAAGHLWTNQPVHGQTFTTGSNPYGYKLNAITMRRDPTGGSNFFFGGPSIQVGTVSGTTLTPIATDSTGQIGTNPNDYVTVTLASPIYLASNTLYGFDWASAGFNGFITANNDANPYGSGVAYSSGTNANPDNANLAFHSGIGSGADRVFHLDIDAVPEPQSIALSVIGLVGLVGFGIHRRSRAK